MFRAYAYGNVPPPPRCAALTLKAGDRLLVRLAENPSTGHRWGTLAKPGILRTVSSRYVATLKLRYTGPTGADGGRFSLRVTVR